MTCSSEPLIRLSLACLSPSGTLVNLAVNYKLTPQLTLWGTGRNILNAQYEAASGFAVPGASFLTGARLDF